MHHLHRAALLNHEHLSKNVYEALNYLRTQDYDSPEALLILMAFILDFILDQDEAVISEILDPLEQKLKSLLPTDDEVAPK